MGRRLSDEAIRHLARFEELTGIEAVDCLIDEGHDRIVFVVAPGELAEAIGPGGETVDLVEARLDTSVALVEFATHPGDFVANALRPAAVYEVAIDDGVAHVSVADDDRGVAIGRDGRTIELARRLVARHFDLDDVVLT